MDGPLAEVLNDASHPTALYGFINRNQMPYAAEEVDPAVLAPSAFHAEAYPSIYLEELGSLRHLNTPVPYETPRHLTTARPNQPTDWSPHEVGQLLDARSRVIDTAVQAAMPPHVPNPTEPHMPELQDLFTQFLALASFGNQQTLRDRINNRTDAHAAAPAAPSHFYRGGVPAAATFQVPLGSLAAVDQTTVGATVNNLAAHQARRTDPETLNRRQQAAQELASLITTGQLHQATLNSGQQFVSRSPLPPAVVEIQPLPAPASPVERAMSIISAAQIAVSSADDLSLARTPPRTPPLTQQTPPATPTPARDRPSCCICQEEYEQSDQVAGLRCRHHYHLECCDRWTAALVESGDPHTCPQCRAELIIDNVGPAYDPATIPDAGGPAPRLQSSNSFSNVTQSQYPIWPASIGLSSVSTQELESLTFHTSTQLESGERSLIVDPGAFTSLIGKSLALQIARERGTQDMTSIGKR